MNGASTPYDPAAGKYHQSQKHSGSAATPGGEAGTPGGMHLACLLLPRRRGSRAGGEELLIYGATGSPASQAAPR